MTITFWFGGLEPIQFSSKDGLLFGDFSGSQYLSTVALRQSSHETLDKICVFFSFDSLETKATNKELNWISVTTQTNYNRILIANEIWIENNWNKDVKVCPSILVVCTILYEVLHVFTSTKCAKSAFWIIKKIQN